jgi:hypothetical protein
MHSCLGVAVGPLTVDTHFILFFQVKNTGRGGTIALFDELKREGSHIFNNSVMYRRFKKLTLTTPAYAHCVRCWNWSLMFSNQLFNVGSILLYPCQFDAVDIGRRVQRNHPGHRRMLAQCLENFCPAMN